jgi:hypothetical protein
LLNPFPEQTSNYDSIPYNNLLVHGFPHVLGIGSQDGNILPLVSFKIAGLLGIAVVLFGVAAEHCSVSGDLHFLGKGFFGLHLRHKFIAE